MGEGKSLAPLESQVRAADGTRLYVQVEPGGIGPTLLFCDGIACDGFIWRRLWRRLLGLSPLAHFHYRGHGRSGSPVDPDRIDVAAHASDVDQVRRELGDPRVVLVGHSFGTQVALEAYRLRPDGVAGLVFLCGSFGRVTYTFKGSDLLASLLPQLVSFVERHPNLTRALWSRVPIDAALRVAKLTGDLDPTRVSADDVRPYFEHVRQLDSGMFLRMLRAAGEHSAQDLLPQVAVPALIVAGERDSFTPPELSRAMAEAIPESEFVLLPQSTHLAPLERDAEVASAMQSFLERRVR